MIKQWRLICTVIYHRAIRKFNLSRTKFHYFGFSPKTQHIKFSGVLFTTIWLSIHEWQSVLSFKYELNLFQIVHKKWEKI